MQTLSRLNCCAAFKNETCILDFVNNPYEIKKAFECYYKTTTLFGETDSNRLNELIYNLNRAEVYSKATVEEVVTLYLKNEKRAKVDSIINDCVENYNELDIDDKINFKRNVIAFIRIYNFLAVIMPCSSSA